MGSSERDLLEANLREADYWHGEAQSAYRGAGRKVGRLMEARRKVVKYPATCGPCQFCPTVTDFELQEAVEKARVVKAILSDRKRGLRAAREKLGRTSG